VNPIVARLFALDDALAERSFPRLSPWWRETLRRFYESDRRQCVLRVGRRGGKSSTLCRVGVCEALYGEHVVPPGDLAVVGIVSVSRDEASQRMRTIKAILDALGVKYRPIEGGLELEHKAVAFKVYTATVAGVSGFTCICAIGDEVSKWRDADTGANPATEVLASWRPTIATQRRAKFFLSSSPVSHGDAHAVAYDQGETGFQCVAYAPTWVANPTVTEAETHNIEPDARKWRREYLAEPQASQLAAFDPDHIDRAFANTVPKEYRPCSRVVLVDPTAGASDTYAFAVAGWHLAPVNAKFRTKRIWSVPGHKWLNVVERDENEKPIPNPEWQDTRQSILAFDHINGIDQAMRRGITSDQIVAHIVRHARQYGAMAIHSDQFERFALQSAVHKHGIAFVAHTWTAPQKERAVERVRRWLAEGTLVLPQHEAMRSQLLAFEETISPSGALTFRGRRGGHDDYCMLIMLGALVDIEGQLPGSPIVQTIVRDTAALTAGFTGNVHT
jgi:hypothetical protein